MNKIRLESLRGADLDAGRDKKRRLRRISPRRGNFQAVQVLRKPPVSDFL